MNRLVTLVWFSCVSQVWTACQTTTQAGQHQGWPCQGTCLMWTLAETKSWLEWLNRSATSVEQLCWGLSMVSCFVAPAVKVSFMLVFSWCVPAEGLPLLAQTHELPRCSSTTRTSEERKHELKKSYLVACVLEFSTLLIHLIRNFARTTLSSTDKVTSWDAVHSRSYSSLEMRGLSTFVCN